MEVETIKEEELNGILAEVEAENFCECVATKEKKNVVKVNAMNKTVEKKQKNVKIDKNIAKSLGKTVALMTVAGACGYFELAKPILYASVELVCLCVICFKLGEFKGKTNN